VFYQITLNIKHHAPYTLSCNKMHLFRLCTSFRLTSQDSSTLFPSLLATSHFSYHAAASDKTCNDGVTMKKCTAVYKVHPYSFACSRMQPKRLSSHFFLVPLKIFCCIAANQFLLEVVEWKCNQGCQKLFFLPGLERTHIWYYSPYQPAGSQLAGLAKPQLLLCFSAANHLV
jgi:hypothetical protein